MRPDRRLRSILAPFICMAMLTACAHDGFHRFMDHPVLSWVPLDRWGIVPPRTMEPRPATPAQFPDPACFEVAKERTEVLDPSQFDPATLQAIFAHTYRDCMAASAR